MKENKLTDRFYETDINLEEISEIKNINNEKIRKMEERNYWKQGMQKYDNGRE